MAKPGYYNSIEALGGWFNAPGNLVYDEFEIRSTDEKGLLLYRWKAPDHDKAWEDCQDKLRGYNGGLYWIRFFCKKGESARGTGLELSHSPSAAPAVNHIGSVSNGIDLEMQKKLWRYEYEEENQKKTPSLLSGFIEILKSNPETSKEFISGMNSSVSGLLGLAASFLMPKNQSGVAIAGHESTDYVRFGNRMLTEAEEIIIKCKSFTLLHLGDDSDEVCFDGVPLPCGRIIEFPFIQGTKGYNQKVAITGKNVSILMTILE
jgi:hypothetical protein